MRSFYDVLSQLSTSESEHQISSLVSRLDFNDYYTKMARSQRSTTATTTFLGGPAPSSSRAAPAASASAPRSTTGLDAL
jgi:hypothetical protein